MSSCFLCNLEELVYLMKDLLVHINISVIFLYIIKMLHFFILTASFFFFFFFWAFDSFAGLLMGNHVIWNCGMIHVSLWEKHLQGFNLESNFYEVTRKHNWYNLIRAKVLHRRNFIKHAYITLYCIYYHARSPSNFQNFSKFLKNFWAISGHGTFRLCAFIAMFVGCFSCYTYKEKVDTKFRNLTKN